MSRPSTICRRCIVRPDKERGKPCQHEAAALQGRPSPAFEVLREGEPDAFDAAAELARKEPAR
jgi:hypothetical protein